MAGKVVSKEDFTKLVVKQFEDNLSTKDAELIVSGVIKALVEGMKKGKIKIYKFGSFQAVVRPKRNGRNPRTGENIKIPERVAIKFNPSPKIKEILASALLEDESSKKVTKKAAKASKKTVSTKKAASVKKAAVK